MEAKVIKVRENVRSYQSHGTPTYVHMVTIEGDPGEWEYHAKTAQCVKFQPGETVTAETKVEQNGNYTNRKIVPVIAKQDATPRRNITDQDRQRIIVAQSSASTAANYYQQRNGSEEEVLKFAEKIYQWVMTK